MKKLCLAFGLLLAAVGASWADVFSHTTDQNSGAFSTTVVVPSAGMCYQYGAAYGTGFIDNWGPLGTFRKYPGDALSISGPVAPGSYQVVQFVYYSGYSGTVIAW
ncbi:hypothetical protein DB347_06650 [Opitutaceae bacterium EW11]|nr:hypothetical protein DB347_06650 [Opitutaceae bacterium EW11]